jgi:glutamate racemase
VKAIQELMPQENILYFGDTAHLPYGDKSPEVLRGYAEKITQFLLGQQVKAIVVACNTASATVFNDISLWAEDVPTYEVITPAVQEATKKSFIHRYGVIGTSTTIASHVYKNRIEELVPNAKVFEKATPLLVPLIEDGWINHKLATQVIDAYMSDGYFVNIDALVLGCTHYPMIAHQFKQYIDKNSALSIEIIDSSKSMARALLRDLKAKGLLIADVPDPDFEPVSFVVPEPVEDAEEAPTVEPGYAKYYVSDINPNFRKVAESFFGAKLDLVRKML